MNKTALFEDYKLYDYSSDEGSPIYKQVTYQIIPDFNWPSKSFDIKSCHVAVKSQQLSIIGSKKSCMCEKKVLNSLKVPDPSNGFQLVEYADKCCSAIVWPSRKKVCKCASGKVCKCASKAIVTDLCKRCDKSVACDMCCVPSKVICVPPPSKSCLKSKPSSVRTKATALRKKASKIIFRKSLSKEMVVCRRCKEKMNRERFYEKCRCNDSGSVVYFHHRKRNCGNGKRGQKRPDDSFYKVQCDNYKSKYLDLINRIKCMFTRSGR